MTTPPQQPGQGDEPNELHSNADQQPEAQATGGEQDPAGGGKKKRKTGLIVGIAAAAVIVIAGAVTGGVLFAKGAFASADSVAKEYVAVATQELHDPRSVTPDDYRPYVCDKAMTQIEKLQKQKEQYLKNAKPEQLDEMKKMKNSVANVQENGDKAEATIVQNAPGQQPQKAKMPLVKDGMSWKICTS